jgi:hypothetical protein
MNLIEAPVLAMPVRPEGPLSFRQFIRLVRGNTLATYCVFRLSGAALAQIIVESVQSVVKSGH